MIERKELREREMSRESERVIKRESDMGKKWRVKVIERKEFRDRQTQIERERKSERKREKE